MGWKWVNIQGVLANNNNFIWHTISQKQQTKKISNFTVNRDHSYKSKETTWSPTYTCRYSSGHLIPIIQFCQNELRIKMPTRISAGVDDHPFPYFFITMIPIDCKITNTCVIYILCTYGREYFWELKFICRIHEVFPIRMFYQMVPCISFILVGVSVCTHK